MAEPEAAVALCLSGGVVLRAGGIESGDLWLAGGHVVAPGDAPGRVRHVDMRGWTVLPGIVDAHGDGFERHVAPRRGALTDLGSGLLALEAELAANGITTAVLAQFFSWEGGLRGPHFAGRLAAAWAATAPGLATDLRLQLRLETHLLDAYPQARALVAQAGIGQVVFNDHLPHDRLAVGRRPARLTGQALKSGRDPAAHLALMQDLHARRAEVPGALATLAADLSAAGVLLGSHDDRSAADRAWYRGLGARLSEFPETREAAQAARSGGDAIVMGAPNVVRGASHAGKVNARALVAEGLVDALASDYHYPAPRHAVLTLVREGVCDLAAGWTLVSEGPARCLGLRDRGQLEPGARADLVVLDPATGRVGATLAGGRVSYLATPLAERFLA